MNQVLIEDFEKVIRDGCVDWKQLYGRTILVTGATGLIGALIVKALAYCNEKNSSNIKILALVRNLQKAQTVFEKETVAHGVRFVVSDVTDPLQLEESIDFIIHAAAITESKKMVTQPVETIFTAVDGTRNMLELARQKNIKSMVYISSMEVYGITAPEKKIIAEEDLGYIDHLAVRSSYSEGKRCCEMICAAYCKEYGVPAKIARLAQTFGAGVPKDETRVFAQFAKCAINGEDIVLHTRGESFGNYCYTADVVKGLLCILTRGNAGEAYTLVNEATTMRIKDMAALVAGKLAGRKIDIVFDIPKDCLTYGYAPDVTMHLSGVKVRRLGWKAKVGIEEMYRRMIKDWQSSG